MTLRRRDFLKGVAGGTLLATAAPGSVFSESGVGDMPSGAVGILYDATLCVGCQTCMTACKEANVMPDEHTGNQELWDNPKDLSSITLNLIKKYEHGNASVKDMETDGYAFIKQQCMHCLKPSCASACPASALTKDKTTGIVAYNPDACIGCRYCQVACPFNVPKFEWANPFPKIVKCQLCSHIIKTGGISACCSICPTGASLYGPVPLLLKEARARLGREPGAYYQYPVGHAGSAKQQSHKAKKYINTIYGESEVGGTQVMMLSGVPFAGLGMPDLPDASYAVLSETIQHTLYNKMILPAILLGGLSVLIAGRKKGDG